MKNLGKKTDSANRFEQLRKGLYLPVERVNQNIVLSFRIKDDFLLFKEIKFGISQKYYLNTTTTSS